MGYTKTMMKKFYSMSLQTKCYENVANFQVVTYHAGGIDN